MVEIAHRSTPSNCRDVPWHVRNHTTLQCRWEAREGWAEFRQGWSDSATPVNDVINKMISPVGATDDFSAALMGLDQWGGDCHRGSVRLRLTSPLPKLHRPDGA